MGGVVWSADFSRVWMATKGMPQGEITVAEALEISEELSIPIPAEVEATLVHQPAPSGMWSVYTGRVAMRHGSSIGTVLVKGVVLYKHRQPAHRPSRSHY